MIRSRSGRAHYPPEKRAALVSEFRSGRETQKAFARRRGINWTTFRNWLYGRRAAIRNSGPPVRFQEIRLVPPGPSSRWAAEIRLHGGTVMRLQAGADPQWAKAILQLLREPC
jgi:hypothetical protein